jgi:hypothetical protein
VRGREDGAGREDRVAEFEEGVGPTSQAFVGFPAQRSQSCRDVPVPLNAPLLCEMTTAAPTISAPPATVPAPHASPSTSTPRSAPTSGSRFRNTPAREAGTVRKPTSKNSGRS